MSEWLHESPDSRYGAFGTVASTAEPILPSQYIRRPSYSHTVPSTTGPAGQPSPSSSGAPTGIPDSGSAKKRWLRQAISEETDPLNFNHPSPTSTNNSRPNSPAVECAAPLKKRRLARASMSSEVSNTPPSTPTPSSFQDRDHVEQQLSALVSLQSELMELTENMAKNPLPPAKTYELNLPQSSSLSLGLCSTPAETTVVGCGSFEDISDEENGCELLTQPEDVLSLCSRTQEQELIEVDPAIRVRPVVTIENPPNTRLESSPQKLRYVSRWDQTEPSPTKRRINPIEGVRSSSNSFIPISALEAAAAREDNNSVAMGRLQNNNFRTTLEFIRDMGMSQQIGDNVEEGDSISGKLKNCEKQEDQPLKRKVYLLECLIACVKL